MIYDSSQGLELNQVIRMQVSALRLIWFDPKLGALQTEWRASLESIPSKP